MYRPSDEALMQLGLYDYVWGDNAMLQNYLNRLSQEEQRQFQAEENAKNRQAQREYNEYLKEYDKNKQLEEDYRADRIEYAKLQKERSVADPRTKVVINEQMKNLEDKYENSKYKDFFSADITKKMDEATALAIKQDEQRANTKLQIKNMLDKADNIEDKLAILQEAKTQNKVMGSTNMYNTNNNLNEPLTEEDFADLAKYAEGVETKEDALRKNAQNQLIKNINEALDKRKAQKELAIKAKAKVDKGYKLTKDEQDAYDAVYGGK